MSALRKSILAACVVAASSLASTGAYATGESYVALLYGGNEIDSTGAANAGDKDGYGIATINFVGKKRVCFTLFVTRIDKPVAAHIHAAPAGINGPVVIPLVPVPPAGAGHVSSNCVRGDRKDIAAIKKDPAAFYVNVHTDKFPNGAIRGQLF